jgi:hypothetical protein
MARYESYDDKNPLDKEWDDALVKILKEKGFYVYATIVDAEIEQTCKNILREKKLD